MGTCLFASRYSVMTAAYLLILQSLPISGRYL
jgi:hypothetical protein